MEGQLYSDFASKAKKSKAVLDKIDQSIRLKDIANVDWHILSKSKIIQAYCNDLKRILVLDDVYKIIEELLMLESILGEIATESDNEIELPKIATLYTNFSPILFRSLLENRSDMATEVSIPSKALKEPLRIAIEEELYIWQDKLIP